MNKNEANRFEWNNEDISNFVTSPSLDSMIKVENFYLTKRVKFLDDVWDFSYIFLPEINFTQQFEFTNIENYQYKLLLKRYILQELVIKRNRVTTVWYTFYYTRRFLLYLEEHNIKNVEDIDISDVEAYLTQINYTNHYSKSKLKKILRNFFSLFSDLRLNENIKNIDIYLENYFSWNQEKKYIKRGTTPSIPKSLQKKIIECALRDLVDTNRSQYNRLAAGIIIILFYTGMRNRELRLLEANQLEEISIFSGTESAYMLNFRTFKTIKYGEFLWTKAKAFPELVKAYQELEYLTRERREKFKIDYLFLTKKGHIMGKPQIYYMIDNFFYRHQKEIGFHNLTSAEKLLVRTKIFTKGHHNTYGHQKEFTKVGEKFHSISPHQFRVAFANNLKDKVTLEWVQEHMNHMSPDMTKYYFRDDYEIRETLLYKANKDGSQLDTVIYEDLNDIEMIEACDTINKFLTKKKLNIFTNLDEILDSFSNNPFNESLIGLCSKAVIYICERQDKLNIIENWYYNAPTITSIDSIDFTIKRFFEKCKIVDHNLKLTNKNKMYLRNYEVEYESLKRFYKNRMNPEIDFLIDELEHKSHAIIIDEFPNLESIIINFEKNMEEINHWERKLKLNKK